MIRPESLDMGALNCSLDAELGDYYQDFSPAILLVESGYHGGFDDDGVPLVRYGGQGMFHNAVITAQYALANMHAVRRGDRARADRTRVLLDWLVATQEAGGHLAGCWLMEHDNPKYRWLRAPWVSALAAGNGISALLRGWELFGDERYRESADAAYQALHRPETGLVLDASDGRELWYEEYPSDPPLHVLNGHVYALLGVVDQARVTGDPAAHERWRRACATVLTRLPAFDLGFWSAYDLRWREPVSLHYQKNIHVPQMRVLAALTGERRFADTADRWERQYRSPASRARRYVAVRSHRWRRADEPTISLRPFPYPFRAALSISNDADQMTADGFRRLHRFLSTGADSEWGPGLGLDVGGSFFMFRSPDSPNGFTVFDHLTSTITADGEFVLECAARGLLDVLHTFGCFTDPSHFDRRLAETALDVLRDRRITIETWINHGPPTNVQCIGTHEGWQGDAPGTPGYHADLTVDHGIRWIWTGDETVDEIALDGQRGARRGAPGLVEPYTLRDGRDVHRFHRFSGLKGRTPVLDDLPRQLSRANLDRLVAAGGYAVVYQHLAVRRVRPGFGVGAYGPVAPGWFAPAEVAALRRLAQRHHDGDLWVAPTTRLLRYHEAHRHLSWQAQREGERDVIVVRPAGGSAQELADLTFYCQRPEDTAIRLETAEGLQEVLAARANPPDHTMRRSITIAPSAAAGPLP